MVLKHIVSVDGAVSDHALAIQLVVSSKALSLQISETHSAFSILHAKGQSNNNLIRTIVIHSAQQLHICHLKIVNNNNNNNNINNNKHVLKRVITLEMSCPWVTNREKKKEEKTTKYGPLRWELKQNYQRYKVKQ